MRSYHKVVHVRLCHPGQPCKDWIILWMWTSCRHLAVISCGVIVLQGQSIKRLARWTMLTLQDDVSPGKLGAVLLMVYQWTTPMLKHWSSFRYSNAHCVTLSISISQKFGKKYQVRYLRCRTGIQLNYRSSILCLIHSLECFLLTMLQLLVWPNSNCHCPGDFAIPTWRTGLRVKN